MSWTQDAAIITHAVTTGTISYASTQTVLTTICHFKLKNYDLYEQKYVIFIN